MADHDISFGQVPPYQKDWTKNPKFPWGGVCANNHTIPDPKSVRWWSVSGKTSVLPEKFHGVYCEHCVRIVHRLAIKIKEGKQASGDK
jgi:hypothetical protein